MGLTTARGRRRGACASRATSCSSCCATTSRPCSPKRRAPARPPPPLPSRTNWTRLVPRPVLNGHVSSPPVLTKRADGSPLSAVGALLVGLEQRGPGRGSALLVKRLIPSASCSSSREALIVAVILRPGARCVRDHWRGGAAAAGVQDQLRQRARAVAARDGRQHPRHLSACRGGPRGARGARDASQGGGGAARGGGGPGAALRRARGALPQAVCARDVAAHGAHTQVGAPCPSSCPLLSCVVPLHRLPAVVVAPDSSSPSLPLPPHQTR